MVRLHSLDLILDDATDARIRAQWDALAAAGLPSQARHRSSTNAPHITLLQAASIPPESEETVGAALAPYLPMRFTTSGLVFLGSGPYTLAHLMQPNARTSRLVGDLRRLDLRPDRTWLPHVTLARRLQRADLAAAMAVVAGQAPPDVTAVALRRWDPDRSEVHTVVAGAPAWTA